MAVSSAIRREVRWRVTGTTAWSDIQTCSPVGELTLEGLDRTKSYDVEIRDISACGAKSAWVLHSAVIPDVAPGNIVLSDVYAATVNAQADATSSLAQLADIASDGKLTADEKVAAKQRYNTLTAEQSGIDAQATSYGITTEKANYDSAITSLKNYLKTTVGVLDASFVWASITGTTAITRATWDSNWTTAYTAKTTLLNAIYAAAKSKADAAAALRSGMENLAAKSRMTAETALTWGSAGWGFRVVGTGATQAPNFSFAAGLLKPNTKYSLRFRAKMVAGPGFGMPVDLYPDTLPQSSNFSVTAADTAFTWEGVSSASVDMSGAVSLRFILSAFPSGSTMEIADIVFVEGDIAPASYVTPAADLADSSAAAKAAANAATGQVSQLPVINGGFDIAPTGYGWNADPGSGWTIDTAGNTPGIGPNSAMHPAGSGGILVFRNAGLAACQPDQVYKTQALIKAVGANGSCYVAISWCNAAGGEITATAGNLVTGTTTAGSYAIGVAPAGTVYARTILVANGHTAGTYYADNVVCTQYPSSIGEVPDGGGRYAVHQVDGNGLAVVDFSQAAHVNKNLDNIGDGATYGRVNTGALTGGNVDLSKAGVVNKTLDNLADTATYGRVSTTDLSSNRIGLRVPGSGQTLGNQLNAPNSLTLNYGASRTTTALTATSAGAVSVNAFTFKMGGASVSYNAVSNAVTGLTGGVTYQIYCHDAGGTGGTKTWFAVAGTQTDALSIADDVVVAGQVTIPSSGSSGGGGSGSGCPVVGAYVIRRTTEGWAFARAGEVVVGDELLLTSGHWGRVSQSRAVLQPCVIVRDDDGYALSCSRSAPLGRPDGSQLLAPDAAGELIESRTGATQGASRIATVRDIGEQLVQHITCENDFFWVGDEPGRLFSHHNLKP